MELNNWGCEGLTDKILKIEVKLKTQSVKY